LENYQIHFYGEFTLSVMLEVNGYLLNGNVKIYSHFQIV